MKGSSFRLFVLVLALIYFAVEQRVFPAPNDKEPVYEGRTLSQWIDTALTADRGSLDLRNACVALLQLDRETVVDGVLKALKSKDAQKRYRSIGLLFNLRLKAEIMVPLLIDMLKDKDDRVRASAVVTLGKFGPKAKDAQRPLTALLKDKDARVRAFAASAVACIDPAQTRTMVAHLEEALKEEDADARRYATYALGYVRAKEALIPLGKALRDDNAAVRRVAAGSLHDFGARAAPAVPALIRALTDSDSDVRSSVAAALGAIGPSAKAAVPALIEALNDREPKVRWSAANSLGAIGPEAKAAERPLRAKLRDEEPLIRIHAACALGRINADRTGEMTTLLIRELANENPSVRVSAIGGLTAFGRKARAAIKPLTAALKDSDPLVRRTAAFALREIDSPATPREKPKD